MEDDIFRDYCKAENSDDEEANRDIQSQLYAKIYYAPNNIENVDIKPDIKFEPQSTDNEEFCNKANSSRTCGDNAEKEDVRRNYENNDITSDPALAEEDNKSNVNSTCIGNQIEISDKNRKNNLNVSYTLQHPQGNVNISQDGKGSTSQRVESINHSNSSSTSRDVCIKPGVEKESEVELNTTNLNFEINESATQSHSKSTNSCVNSEGENIQEKFSIIRQDVNYDDNYDNILTKYEFSKLFINELYQEKYENLKKELQKLEEEKEMSLKEKEQKEQIKEKDERIRQSDTRANSMSETEADSKYNVHTKNEKQCKSSDYFEDEILLSSDTETDSEESILEVPIPPKPKPPVINLQDSEDSDALSNNDSDECSFIVENKINKKVSRTSLRKTNSSNDELVNIITEDIVLNCSGVQKAASSIREIKEMSKNIQNKSGECHNKNKNDSEGNKSASTSKICNKNLNNTRKSLSSSEKDNIPEFRVPAVPSDNSNVVFERDKNKSVTSMEDVTNFEISNQPSSSRKRHRENEGECSVNVKRKKHSHRKDTPSEVCTDQHGDKDKTETLWEDYFFRPMSEKLKVFYNESRGQENFNVQDIQSKMSKDPRLWAVLDDDLMPNFAQRKRFWNVRCNNCNEMGHQAYNCSLPRKPPRCYMCGTQGHTETRCPQKMCLTCGKRQGTFRKTCEFCRTLYCDMCKAIGHKSTECPDHWRRFHQTTQNSEIHIPENLSEVMKPADLLYCCNCTRRGHDSSTCHDYRWSQHFPTPAFVTNYMGERQCEKRRNIASEDIIPLKDKSKQGKNRNQVILEGLGDLQYSSILYRYGSFRTLKHNGQIWDTQLEGDLYFKTDNFLKNEFPPSFLDELVKIVSFDLIIYRTDNKALFVRIRTFNGIAVYIYQIFMYWLKLNDEDKRLLKVYINIPRDDKKMLNILYAKWEEMLKTSDDPRILTEQIQSLKSSLTEICDPSILHTTTDRISRLRTKLLNLYNSTACQWLDKLRQITKAVRKSVRKSKGINDRLYLRCIYSYNEIYLPRTLTKKELHELFNKYYAKPKKIDNVKSKKQKKKLDPYAQFLQSLQQNNMLAPQKKEGKRNLKNSSTTSSNIIQEKSKKISASTENTTQEQIKKLPTCPTTKNVTTEQGKKIPTYISTANFTEAQIKKTAAYTTSKNVSQEHSNEIPACTIIETTSTTRNVECNDNVIRTNIGVRSERCYVGENSNTVSESNAVHPIETVITTSLRNNDASTNDKVENTMNQIQERIPKPNVISIPMIDTISHQPGNNQIKRTFYTLEQNNDNDSEKNMETVKNNNAPATSSLQQKDTVNLEISASKKKKKKKRKTSESNTDVAKNEVASNDLSVENKAKKIINEALEFNLPYMNKAVEEVKKRINDKNIKQEHIDVLQRLINLEKDHQQYVSSFCSYLK